ARRRTMWPMEWAVSLECRLAGEVLHRTPIATIARAATPLRPEHLRLTLSDGKTILCALQHAVIADQIEVEATAWSTFRHCQRRKRIKDRRRRCLRTIFGEVVVWCRRYHGCSCRRGWGWRR